MQVAQGLYEGVKLPEYGLTGLITYMRTDSTRISDEARNAAKDVIINNFGEEKLLSSTIIITKQAETLFKEQINQIILQYKNALEDSKTLLVTRQFFEKKWLLNSCNFIKYAKTFLKQT